jgi:hypothetical protein
VLGVVLRGSTGLSRLRVSSIIHVIDKETLLLTRRVVIQSVEIVI